jgi:hypothetical protein
MNKVKYFAYLPTQSKNGEPEKGKQTYFMLGLRCKFFMNNPYFETQQHTAIMV